MSAQGRGKGSAKARAPLVRRRDERADEIRAQYAEVAGGRERVALEQISERVHGDTRALDERHVEGLVESLSVLGLITPLTIDERGALLAGGHRREALKRLQERAPERFEELFPEGIPVHRLALNSALSPVEALQLEVEENTQRLNYSPQEIREAARRLEEAGYERLRGRPKAGQKSLKRALQDVFRLSDRRIQQLLNEPTATTASAEPPSPTLELSPAAQAEAQLHAALKPLKRQLSRAAQRAPHAPELSDEGRATLEALHALIERLSALGL